MSGLSLEVVEGPGAGLKVPLDRPIVIGRGEEADLVLDNKYTSRAHARITPGSDQIATVEDLDSANGTFVNQAQVHGPTSLGAGDELLVGVSVFALRTAEDKDSADTVVRAVPPPLAAPQRAPRYVAPEAFGEPAKAEHPPELERLLDVNVKLGARIAPFAIVVLVALIVAVYLGAR